uniref:Retrotransposon gag domain-containing protein n=1 Tax=Tanacetum cinerariifolium TaxID=118510 RepID=A0A6L2JLX3_TANCI|nr:hypothetical protein [Tanacetum cinerariifolium]
MSGPYKPTTVLVEAVAAIDDSSAIPEHTTMKCTRLLMLAKQLRKCGKLSKGYNKNKNVDTTPQYKNDNQSGQFGNQRTINVAGARENIGSPVVQQYGIQCFNYKEFRHFAKECRKPKRVKDSAYHKEKMLLCKQAEQGVPLQAEQYDWLADTDKEIDEQKLEAYYSYMAKIQEVPTTDTGTDSEPVEQVQNDAGYNVFANDLQHSKQSESVSNTCIVETDDSNVNLDSPDMYSKAIKESIWIESSTQHSSVNDFEVINIPKEDVEPKQIILGPNDQPMWESAKTVASTPSYTNIQLDVDENFVVNTTHLNMIRENKFDGYLRADPHDHIREILTICDMFKYGETESEAIKLLIFPVSLYDEAKIWFNELNEETITSWELRKKTFINKFFSPSLFNRLLLEIRNFAQLAMDSQIISLNEELQDIRDKYNELRVGNASKNHQNDDTLMCERHEVNYIQSGDYHNRNSHDLYSHQSHHDPNDSERSLTKLNNDVRNDLEDFKRWDFAAALAVLITKASQSRQHSKSEPCITRSSTNELFTPFKESEREFRSSRKHFKSLSLKELRSLDFNLFSDQEYSDEKEAETMVKTMEQYMRKTRTDYGSGVARPKIDNKDQFELEGQFLKELRENTFSGSDHEDANEHIEKVLKIVDLFHVPNITVDQLMLRVFPISLTGSASCWLRTEPTGLIKTLEDLKTKCLNKYCPPGRTAKKMEEIKNFQQESDETLYQAWERFKELLMKRPQHYLTKMREVILFYNRLDVPTRQIIDSRCDVPTKTVPDAKKVIQEMAEYSYKWHNGTSRGRSIVTFDGLAAIQAQLNNLGRNQEAKRHEENSNLIKEIRASTDAAIRNQGASIKTLEFQIGQMSKVLQERGFGSLPSSTKTNPRDQVKSISTNIKANSCPICRVGSSKYAVSTRQNSYSEASHIDNSIPQKEKDPGSFTLPGFINNVCFDNALVDLGASVSVMPLSTYLNLGLGELAHNMLTVKLADRIVKYPKEIAENMIVGIVELRRNQGDDLMPTIEKGEVIEEFRTRDDKFDTKIDDYPSDCDYDNRIHIDFAVNYNQGNFDYRPSGVANQIRPPGFSQPNVQNNQNRFSQSQGYNRGNNFNQDSSYQAPMQQNQVVPLSELEKIKKMNEINTKAMQTQINNVKNELRNEMKTSIKASIPLPSNTISNPKGELKAITTRSGLVLDGPSVHMHPPFINLEEDERVEETLTDSELGEFTIKVPPPLVQKAKPPSQRNYVLAFDVHKCRMIPQLVIILEGEMCTYELIMYHILFFDQPRPPEGGFCNVYKSDHRVPLILGRPFLRTARALIDVHGEEMILCDGDKRLTLNMRHDTSSYSNQPQKESINMINIYDDSYEDYLEDLFVTNHLSGNPTFSSHPDLTSLEVFNPLSGSTTSSSPDHLLEELADELALITFPPGNNDLPFVIEYDLREIEYLLNYDPTKEMDSILEDSVDEGNLADPNDNLFDTIPEMFTDEHALDYSSPPLYDEYDDDLVELEFDN